MLQKLRGKACFSRDRGLQVRESILRAHPHSQDSLPFSQLSRKESDLTHRPGSNISTDCFQNAQQGLWAAWLQHRLGEPHASDHLAASSAWHSQGPILASTATWGLGRAWLLQRHSEDTLRNGPVDSRLRLGYPDCLIMPCEFFHGINTKWGSAYCAQINSLPNT